MNYMITLFTISKTMLQILTKNTIMLHNENEAAKVMSWYIHRGFKGFFLASINRSDRQQFTVYQAHFATTKTSAWVSRNFVFERAQFSSHNSVVLSQTSLSDRSMVSLTLLRMRYHQASVCSRSYILITNVEAEDLIKMFLAISCEK